MNKLIVWGISSAGLGRGMGFLMIIAGMLLCGTSVILYKLRRLKCVKAEVSYVLQNNPQ